MRLKEGEALPQAANGGATTSSELLKQLLEKVLDHLGDVRDHLDHVDARLDQLDDFGAQLDHVGARLDQLDGAAPTVGRQGGDDLSCIMGFHVQIPDVWDLGDCVYAKMVDEGRTLILTRDAPDGYMACEVGDGGWVKFDTYGTGEPAA